MYRSLYEYKKRFSRISPRQRRSHGTAKPFRIRCPWPNGLARRLCLRNRGDRSVANQFLRTRGSPCTMVSHEGSAFATGATVRSPTNSSKLGNPPAQWFGQMSPCSWRNFVPFRLQGAGDFLHLRHIRPGPALLALPPLPFPSLVIRLLHAVQSGGRVIVGRARRRYS